LLKDVAAASADLSPLQVRESLQSNRRFADCLRAEIPIVALPTNAQHVAEENNPRGVVPEGPVANVVHARDPHLLPAPAASVAASSYQLPPLRYSLEDFPEPTVSSPHPTPAEEIKKAIPGFFVVIGDEEHEMTQLTMLEVKSDASYALTNPTVRTIMQVSPVSSPSLIPSGNDRLRL
jgi:hypothetical protein